MKMELSQCLTIFQKNKCGDINWKYSYVCNYIYPMDFKLHRDGKGTNPREHR